MENAPANDPPRLIPERAFPPYSYVTGRFAHPTRDPAGHSFGHAAPAPSPLVSERCGESRDYLFGCDLFNHGYYWEAHELWEGLWHACGRSGATADFLKGLIKLAAAGVKAREGRSEGVQRHARRAVELFSAVRAESQQAAFAGLDLDTLVETARTLRALPVADENAPVQVVFAFRLLPRPNAVS